MRVAQSPKARGVPGLPLKAIARGAGVSMLCYIGSRVVDRGRDIRAAIDSCFEAQFDPEDHTALDVIVDQHFPRSGNTTLDVDTTAITEGEA